MISPHLKLDLDLQDSWSLKSRIIRLYFDPIGYRELVALNLITIDYQNLGYKESDIQNLNF